MTTNNTCFSPGEILPGIEFFADPDDLLVLGDSLSASNNPANVLVNSTFVDLLEIGFIDTTDAVGLTLGCVATGFATCAETIVVSVFGEIDNLIGSTNVAVTDSVDAFIGIESVVPIGRISMDFLVFGGSVVKAIHEVKFNSTPLVDIVDVNNGACALTKSSLNRFKIEGATPNKRVAVVMGFQYGSTIVNGGACNGLELAVEQLRIMAIAKADELGNAMFLSPVPPSGDWVGNGFFQVIDIATCTASGLEMYDVLIDEIQTHDDDGDDVVNCQDACPEEGLPGEGQGLGEDGCITDEIIIE